MSSQSPLEKVIIKEDSKINENSQSVEQYHNEDNDQGVSTVFVSVVTNQYD